MFFFVCLYRNLFMQRPVSSAYACSHMWDTFNRYHTFLYMEIVSFEQMCAIFVNICKWRWFASMVILLPWYFFVFSKYFYLDFCSFFWVSLFCLCHSILIFHYNFSILNTKYWFLKKIFLNESNLIYYVFSFRVSLIKFVFYIKKTANLHMCCISFAIFFFSISNV